MDRIPFNKPFMTGKELQYVAEVVNQRQISADGVFAQKCMYALSRKYDIQKVLLTPSCTAALELASLLCDFKPGDEVILPSYTFVSTANAIVLTGATPVFIDIRPDTLNIDEKLIEQAITSRTKAIMPVHYAGVGCEMDAILEIAQRYKLTVIEDAAQAVGAYYNGQALGSIGELGTFSFHDTKNYTCGEGGALCINRPELNERAEVIRDKGTNRKKFLCGQTDKYTWIDVGASYVLSEVLCAFLYAQLEELDTILASRKETYEAYYEEFQQLEQQELLKLPEIPESCVSNYHMFYILLRNEHTRNKLIEYLKDHDIYAVFHYIPLHTAPMGRKVTIGQKPLPVTDDISRRLIRLPFYPDLTEEERTRIVTCVSEFLSRKA